jgi:hypothetical protein
MKFAPLALAGLILMTTPVMTHTPVQAAELETYERKYISFYPSNYPGLHQGLAAAMREDLPRFSYYELPDLDMSLEAFTAQVYAYQQENAGDIAASRETPNLTFGDKVVSWQDTRKVMEAAYVLVPEWQFGPLELKNLHQPSNRSDWYVDLSSKLSLKLAVYRIQDGRPQLYTTLDDNWDVTEELPVSQMGSILAELRNSTGGIADPANPLIQPLILEALKALPGYAQLLQSDPAARMQTAAQESLREASYDGLIKTLKQQGAFSLKTQVEQVDTAADRLVVGMPPGETAASLGAWLDQGYRVVEYRLDNGQEKAVDVGYAKIRDTQEKALLLQPIIGARSFELGDQLIEYPQIGLQAHLFAGTAAFGFEGESQNMFSPQGGLRLEYSLARLLDVSELYGTLSGSAAAPLGLSALNNLPSSVNRDAQALPFTAELGVMKRWFIRQWMLEAGLQVGLSGGVLLNSGSEETPTMLSGGGSALLGTGWQVNPDLLIGLQGGWRFSLPGQWRTTTDFGPSTLAVPGIFSNGPILQVYGSYSF